MGSQQNETAATGKVSISVLAALVVGSMIGAGVFSLPRRFAQETGLLGSLIAWTLAGSGMLMLALVFKNLAVRKPRLNSGVFAYAQAGFGEYAGFLSATGYWAGLCVANVAYWVLIFATLSPLLPALGAGDTWLALIFSTAGIWLFYWLVSRGVKSAMFINKIVTYAKLVPIIVFVLISAFALDPSVLLGNLSGGGEVGSLFEQVQDTMLVTVFVFLGVEGAVVYSSRARSRQDVGKATILGFLSVLAVFASVTTVAYGILPREQIAALAQPSMVGVLTSVTGQWGGVFLSVGLVVSVLGAYLSLTLLAAEVLHAAAEHRALPVGLAKLNARGVPISALLLSSILTQVVLLVSALSTDAFDFALDLTATVTLAPFLFSAAYGLKLAITGDSYRGAGALGRKREGIVALIATIYTVFLVFAAGNDLLLLSLLLYAAFTGLFVISRKEQKLKVFARPELLLLALVLLGGVAALIGIFTGRILV